MKKQRFLTVYDYGSGGVWQYVHAESPEQIMAKYPALEIVNSEPSWLTAHHQKLREYDIEAEPDHVMSGFTTKQ